jgi:uncharacterized protein (UPF0332 family)
MDSKEEMFIRRAKSELDSAIILFNISEKKELKDIFELENESTFFSGSISHSYYAIFYSAKAMLSSIDIKTRSPDIHLKTLIEFERNFVLTGILDTRLLMVYKKMMVQAETLLEIYKEERRKRGDYTYNTISQANRKPAEESIKNAKEFLKHCNSYLINIK